ncbi:MAG TPA: glycosyltransferase family 39 protein [Gammaproteobacteria bacterium]|nr:glycosyltransferase family 39 protein [Gammaproteobacteria bacterium]
MCLRLATVLWGVPGGPDGALHADETKYLSPATWFISYYLTEKPFPLYGTSLQYTVGFFLAPFDVLSRLTDSRESYAFFANVFCRVVVVILGVLAVVLMYRLAERLFDRRTAAFAATFLTIAPYHALNSSWFTIDVPMATLLLVNMLLILSLMHRDRPALYAWWGLAFGYMLGMKLTAGLFLVFPMVLALTGEGPMRLSRWRRLPVFGGVALATFAMLNPQFFLAFDRFIERVALDKIDFWDRHAPDTWIEVVAMQWEGYVGGVGAPIVLAAIAGIGLAGKRQPRVTLALACLLLAYGLYFRHYMLARYTIFVTPVLCMFAGVFCAALVNNVGVRMRIVGVAVLLGVVAATAYLTAGGIVSRWFDPRPQSARFIASEYPPGTTVAFGIDSEEYADTHPWRFPALYRADHRKVGLLEAPTVVVTSSGVMDAIQNALGSEFLAADYSWSPEADDWWYRYSPPSPALFAFYERLLREEDYRLVKTFELPVSEDLAAEFLITEIRVYERR